MPSSTLVRDQAVAGLTEREEAILRLIAGGYSNKVARHLGVAVGTTSARAIAYRHWRLIAAFAHLGRE